MKYSDNWQRREKEATRKLAKKKIPKLQVLDAFYALFYATMEAASVCDRDGSFNREVASFVNDCTDPLIKQNMLELLEFLSQ